jgi:hypothetical protein
MKKLLLLLLLPFLGFSQEKNVIVAERVTPKADKVMEFEKALAAHALKYHAGTNKWRISSLLTGPDAGAYSIVEPPSSWTDWDNSPQLGAEHDADWNKIFAMTTGQRQATALVYRPDLSSGKLTDYADKSSINHVYPRIGFGGKIEANLKKAKKVWEAAGQNVLVYQANSSGEPQYVIVTRHKTGWKEKESTFLKPFPDRYNEVNGAETFDEYLDAIQRYTSKSWGEMQEFRADLSPK